MSYTDQGGLGLGLLWQGFRDFHEKIAKDYNTKLVPAGPAYKNMHLLLQPDMHMHICSLSSSRQTTIQLASSSGVLEDLYFHGYDLSNSLTDINF